MKKRRSVCSAVSLFCYGAYRGFGGSFCPNKKQPIMTIGCETEMREKLVVYGYHVPCGYKGFVAGKYMLFATEEDYLDYIKDN